MKSTMPKTFYPRLKALCRQNTHLELEGAVLALKMEKVDSYKGLLKVAGNPQQSDELRQQVLLILVVWGGTRASHLLVRLFTDDTQRYILESIRARWASHIQKRHLKQMIALMQSHSDPEVRYEAAYLISFSRQVAYAYPALLAVLEDEAETPMIRGQAAEGLGYAGKPEAVPALLQALMNEDLQMRWDVVFALGAIGDPRAIPALEQIATNDFREIPGLRDESGQAITIHSDAIEAIAHIMEKTSYNQLIIEW